ncbi:MAG TPA: metallophosphoesterase [Rectinemataceae bacterium]|nr:metallophosphoesterase [Rectinemataceae bacterium]
MSNDAEFLDQLHEATRAALANPRRSSNAAGRPGGLVELPPTGKIVIVGDIHASLESLDAILECSDVLSGLETGSATLVFLGDIVHDDRRGHLGKMEGSIAILGPLCRLLTSHPAQVLWLRGNHDSFDPYLTKGGAYQGALFRQAVEARGGEHLLVAVQALFDALPLVAVGPSLILVHAGPPAGGMRREDIVEISPDSLLANDLVWNRIGPCPAEYGQYCVDDVKASLDNFGFREGGLFIVGHNPLWSQGDGSGLWKDVGMKGHHILYSGGLGLAPWLSLENGCLISGLARPRD